MDLPDCPPGAEGYEDTVVEVPRKQDETTCTKAEQEFQDHLSSLKIHVEDGTTRCMVERRGRDISGKWIYLCYPCAAVCSGESVLQTHISGKKHKSKLGLKDPWPVSIFEQHPFILGEKGEGPNNKSGATEPVLKKMAEEVELHNTKPSELNLKYNKYRDATCHIQEILDDVKTPLLGLEYLIENPPQEEHYEPTYMCTLCTKQGHPRTIVNHLTCFWHRYNYVVRHYSKACALLAPYRSQPKCREGVGLIMSRLAQRIEDKYGRLRPVNIDKDVYDKEKYQIHQWLYKSYHFAEKPGATFEEVVDIDLINSLSDQNQANTRSDRRDPSPPVVAAPTRPRGAERPRRQSPDTLSDISLDDAPFGDARRNPQRSNRRPYNALPAKRYEPYPEPRAAPSGRPGWRAVKEGEKTERELEKERHKHDYKIKLASEMREKIELSAKKMLAYHEKNPEKHPLYPEEWKKFWNRRYKEIQAEGKDPSKHDFKPEWIVFWTARMKDLHDEEVKVHVGELYRKMCLTPPGERREDERRRSPPRRNTPEARWSPRRRSPARRRSPDARRRSPPGPRRRSPEPRRRSPIPRRHSPEPRRRSPELHPRSVDYRRDRRSPPPRRSPERRHEPPRPIRVHSRSRSPLSMRSAAPRRSPARTHITLESARRSRSPLSSRAAAPLRNRSPAPAPVPVLAPSLQTVQVSDDELKPDDALSPWNSDKSLESLGSLPDARSPPRSRSRTSSVSRASRRPAYSRASDPQDLGPPENVVATLRLLVALEDYLGSIGPKIVDLLTEALKMEKEKANSSEDLLVRDTAVVLIETAKEKLKGAAQAGLVAGGAASAVRAAVVRAAATLHAADLRARQQKKEQSAKPTTSAVPVAGVGEVDRAQIAQQMAAALIAQGKTDVSSEELAQLVEAVVGMAEAKKRKAAEKSSAEQRAVPEKAAPRPAVSGTASALQMLQTAYDENDRRIENETATDAMDGLSDSDLETLLKNFNELSAEEQHSLIAYLKKLEARSPQRVERLRQYVSAAAAPGPAPAPAPADAAPPPRDPPQGEPPDPRTAPVTIDSDDDDYTVEEVFKSATEKVKENQIRQEMEIVKKSLEETKELPVQEVVEKAPVENIPIVDLTNLSSASDLLALVQASIQSTAKVAPPDSQGSDVVTSSQPRSFGDRSESSNEPPRPLLANPTVPMGNQKGGLLRPPPTFHNYHNDSYNNDSWNQSQGNRLQESFMQDDRGPMQGNRGPMHDNRGSPTQNIRSPFMHDNRGPHMQDNRGPHMQDNRGPHMQDNRGLMQDNRGPMQDNRGPMQDNRGPMQDNRGPMQDNRGPMQDNRGPMPDNRGPMQDNHNTIQDNRGPMQDNRGPMQENRDMMQDNRGPPFMQGMRPSMPNMQNRPPLNPGQSMRPQGYDNYGASGPYNQGPRGNYMNGRMQDNYDMNQHQNNFRGRGRGHYGGGRGRGRGFY